MEEVLHEVLREFTSLSYGMEESGTSTMVEGRTGDGFNREVDLVFGQAQSRYS